MLIDLNTESTLLFNKETDGVYPYLFCKLAVLTFSWIVVVVVVVDVSLESLSSTITVVVVVVVEITCVASTVASYLRRVIGLPVL